MSAVLAAIAIVVAGVSAAAAVIAVRHASRSAMAAETSVAEAKRAADAAEVAAAATVITAEADRAADLRAREPRLLVTVDAKVPHKGTEAIYRVLNDGPADLDSVIVQRPVLGEVEGRIIHQVARTGVTDYQDEVEIGPIAATEYARFTLSLGSSEMLPEFRIRITCRVGTEEWRLARVLPEARGSKPPRRASISVPTGQIPGRGRRLPGR